MSEADIPTWILTAALVGVTLLVWRSTNKVAKATDKVADATASVAKIQIIPKISIISHNKVGSDDEHDHFEFILRNEGVGSAFNLIIEIFDKKGSTVLLPIQTLTVASGHRFTYNNVDKNAQMIRGKMKYTDYANNQYEKEFAYSIKDSKDDPTLIQV
jgi:hypothetical protein